MNVRGHELGSQDVADELVATALLLEVPQFFFLLDFLSNTDDVGLQVSLDAWDILDQGRVEKVELFLSPLNQKNGLLTWRAHPQVISFFETPKDRDLVVLEHIVSEFF